MSLLKNLYCWCLFTRMVSRSNLKNWFQESADDGNDCRWSASSRVNSISLESWGRAVISSSSIVISSSSKVSRISSFESRTTISSTIVLRRAAVTRISTQGSKPTTPTVMCECWRDTLPPPPPTRTSPPPSTRWPTPRRAAARTARTSWTSAPAWPLPQHPCPPLQLPPRWSRWRPWLSTSTKKEWSLKKVRSGIVTFKTTTRWKRLANLPRIRPNKVLFFHRSWFLFCFLHNHRKYFHFYLHFSNQFINHHFTVLSIKHK